MDYVLQQVVARAVSQEDKNDSLFDMNYQYTRTRTWEYRNSAGELKVAKKTQCGKQGTAHGHLGRQLRRSEQAPSTAASHEG